METTDKSQYMIRDMFKQRILIGKTLFLSWLIFINTRNFFCLTPFICIVLKSGATWFCTKNIKNNMTMTKFLVTKFTSRNDQEEQKKLGKFLFKASNLWINGVLTFVLLRRVLYETFNNMFFSISQIFQLQNNELVHQIFMKALHPFILHYVLIDLYINSFKLIKSITKLSHQDPESFDLKDSNLSMERNIAAKGCLNAIEKILQVLISNPILLIILSCIKACSINKLLKYYFKPSVREKYNNLAENPEELKRSLSGNLLYDRIVIKFIGYVGAFFCLKFFGYLMKKFVSNILPFLYAAQLYMFEGVKNNMLCIVLFSKELLKFLINLNICTIPYMCVNFLYQNTVLLIGGVTALFFNKAFNINLNTENVICDMVFLIYTELEQSTYSAIFVLMCTNIAKYNQDAIFAIINNIYCSTAINAQIIKDDNIMNSHLYVYCKEFYHQMRQCLSPIIY